MKYKESKLDIQIKTTSEGTAIIRLNNNFDELTLFVSPLQRHVGFLYVSVNLKFSLQSTLPGSVSKVCNVV